MYITLREKKLSSDFIQFFIEFTQIDNIQEWDLLLDTTETTSNSHNDYTINYTYILINPEHNKIAIYLAHFDKSLKITKKFEVFPLSVVLEQEISFIEVSHLNLPEKIKDFQLFYLNAKLSKELTEKNIYSKKNKI